ncbi:MAG: glutamate-5-semialdehyde dehydrogenase [Firmicutes bacterium]|nr:glutamate-5-semialdehyde dehydrogenase [Bacillota bacterium]
MNTQQICAQAKSESVNLATASSELKNKVLLDFKSNLISCTKELISENAKDMQKAEELGKSTAFLDRLRLDEKRILGIAEGISAVVSLPDPVGEITESYTVESGLSIKKMRSPLGVIAIIFEARPNVSADAVALCIKSGNACVLRGSKESVNSVKLIVREVKKALEKNGLSENLVGLIDGGNRELVKEMLSYSRYIDVVIPRGGESLKKVVLEYASMPVIASAGGNCHIYVAPSADLSTTASIVINAKCQRPGVCNATETLLISKKKDAEFVKDLLSALKENGVELRGTEEINRVFPVKVIEDEEFYTEYEDLIIKIKFVSGLESAVAHINKYSTNHSEAIITYDKKEAEEFAKAVDSSAVYINASTRFTDGFEFGLGAEMGISTQKLHVRGPIGLKELTSTKYVVTGNGTIRK